MDAALRFTNRFAKRAWILEMAREHPEPVFTSLHDLIDKNWMREAYRRTGKDVAAGNDGVTAADYELEPKARLADLRGTMLSGSHQGPPFRRCGIAKANGRLRPLGTPTLEDKMGHRP